MLHGIDQTRRGHDLEALVDADKELRRNDCGLNGAELHALDLTRNGAQLARRIDLAFDAAAQILLDDGGEIFGEQMLRFVDGGQRDLHYVGFVLRARRSKRQRQQQRKGARGTEPVETS